MNYTFIAVSSFILVPVIAVILNNTFSKKISSGFSLVLSCDVALLQMAAAAFAFFAMSARGSDKFDFTLLWHSSAEGSAFFSVTPMRLIFLFTIGLVAFSSSLTAIRTVDSKKTSYVNLFMTLLIGMNGMLLVNDLFSLYVFMEVVGLSSFVLIAMFKSRLGLEGSFKYLIMSVFAGVFILTGIAFIFMKTGAVAYADLNSGIAAGGNLVSLLDYVALILLIAGFSIKTGAVPFHSWLPDAHQSADTSVSILLSGIVIKIAGVYGLIVLMSLFGDLKAVRISLAVIGLASIIAGALLALSQNHFKRIVAYSSVSQMGYILLALSTGTTLGLIGAVAHVFSHATFKSTLFVNAAAIHEQTGTLDINEMGGLEKVMPATSFTSVAAFLSTAGIPPFAGFWSKLLIILALWSAGLPVLAGVAIIASILTAAYFLRLQKKVFFGKTPEHLQSVKEIRGSILAAEILLTVITIGVGVCYPLLLLYMQSRGLF